MSRFALPCLLLSVLLAAAFGGCGGTAQPVAPIPRGEDKPLTPVRIMLNWYPEAEHGGYYAALVHGYYEEAGLDVTIVPGGPGAPVTQQTARGAVEFGVTNADRILVARDAGANVRALMAPLSTSPRCLLVHEDSGIESFEDLRDITLMMRRENAWAQYLIANLKLENVDVVPNSASLSPFLDNPKSAKQGYVISEPFVAKSQGAKVRTLMVSELGFNPYTSVLMTSDTYAAANREIIAKVVAASRRGWEKYLESPEETNKHIHSKNPEMGLDILEFGVAAIKDHCLDADAPLGRMTEARWQTLIEQLEALKMIEAGKVRATDAFTADSVPSKN